MAINSTAVILAKTKMSPPHVCVGAYDIYNQRMLRLLGPTAETLSETCGYEVGQTYAITYEARYMLHPPHMEDVAVYSAQLVPSIPGYELATLTSNLSNQNMSIEQLFDGNLNWENLRGYIAEANNINFSVTISSLSHDLRKVDSSYVHEKWGLQLHAVKYVGAIDIAEMPDIIPAGTKIRFSLARMWDRNNDGDRRSYLQLSGIYI